MSHFNQAVLVEVPGDVKPALIEHALAALMNHHDALRSRFVRDGSLWRQDYLPVECVQVDFARFDLADVGPEARIEQLQIAAARIQASLDPEAGRVAAAGWFDFGAAIPGRLLLVIHHLVVDGISWRILLEDLVTAYQQALAGETIRLPAKTTSVTAWAAQLAARARDLAATDELAYWTAACRDAPALPRDRAVDGSCGTHGDSETLTVALSVPETQALLTAVPQAYRSRINDALLAALSLAVADWRGARGEAGTSVLVDLEGHGREDLFPGVDLSRTVGWFTTMYPVRLDAGPLDGAEVAAGGPAAGAALRRIKEQLRAVPHNGISWGLLRHLNPESAGQLQALPRPEIGFNYLGRFDESGSSGWRSAAESPGASVSPHRGRDHLLEVVSLVQGGELRTEWSWWPRA
ncbi:MAG TPA: condensation domain-containing protein, partial [Steroidobacteraceae bacterium]